MLTIATLFDEDTNKEIIKVWSELDSLCRPSQIWSTPLPHFTWQSSLGYPDVLIKNHIDLITNQFSVFNAKTTGLGIFTGINPIIYLPIVKTKMLMELHEVIWEELAPYAENNNNNYSPINWIPHITLAMGNLTYEDIGCAFNKLAFSDLVLEIPVTNISLLSKLGNQPKIDYVKQISQYGGVK